MTEDLPKEVSALLDQLPTETHGSPALHPPPESDALICLGASDLRGT